MLKCREYDHCANECPNSVMDDSDGYESDKAALQLITSDAEIHQNSEGTRLIEKEDYLNLQKVRMLPPHFFLWQRKVDQLDVIRVLGTYQI